MADQHTKDAVRRITRANGAADWHLSTSYQDNDVIQNVSIRADYGSEDRPYDGNVTLHSLHADEEHFSEAQVTISTQELARMCRQYLATLDSDEEHYQQMHEEEEDEDDAEEPEGEEDDDDGDEDEGDDDDGDEDEDEGDEEDEDEDEDEDDSGEEPEEG